MKLIILGAGGYGRTVADIARQSGRYTEVCFLDDNETDELVIGKCSDYINCISPDTELYPAFGNNEGRLQWLERLEAAGANIPTIIHDTAYVSPEATVGGGTVVLPKAIINTGVVVNRGCIINCGAIIDHGCVIEDGVHICLGAITKAENRIQRCMKVEAGVVIENRTYSVC
ncbi:MAG: hypothetical protein IJW40_11095 [Clostridia bacterium]|nr:hypothetical protein [Clostridia bacterium]